LQKAWAYQTAGRKAGRRYRGIHRYLRMSPQFAALWGAGVHHLGCGSASFGVRECIIWGAGVHHLGCGSAPFGVRDRTLWGTDFGGRIDRTHDPMGATAPPVPIKRPAADRPISGDDPPSFGRRSALFRETIRPISGDDPPYFGRRSALFRETIRPISGDDFAVVLNRTS
jgi:hypothetical protein